MTNVYEKYTQEVQLRWSTIKACQLEYLKVYSEQANIKTPKNEHDYDSENEWGLCINTSILFPIPANLFDCSVGQVRKLRNKLPIEYDTYTCKSCPYFIPRNHIKSRTNEQIIKDIKGDK